MQQRSDHGPLVRRPRTSLALDSGALPEYRAKQKGQNKSINIDRLIFFQLMSGDHLDLCFTKDVIDAEDDPEGRVTFDQWEYIRQYVPDVIPIYHPCKGKDLRFLEVYLRESPIVAIGGGADDLITKRREILRHLWETHLLDRHRRPRAKIHGLGVMSAELITRWPWFSVDGTSWEFNGRNGIILARRNLIPSMTSTNRPSASQ